MTWLTNSPQVYNWVAKIKSDNVTVEPLVQKKYATVPAMFAEVGAVMTATVDGKTLQCLETQPASRQMVHMFYQH